MQTKPYSRQDCLFLITRTRYGIIWFLREPIFHILLGKPFSRERANCEKNYTFNCIDYFYPDIWSLGWR
jgi:hypothetical protein